MADSVAKAASNSTTTTPARQPILIDLGKRKKKAVKRLRRGSGPLMRTLHDALTELRSSGTLDGTSDGIVVAVVREKKKRRGGGGSGWGW